MSIRSDKWIRRMAQEKHMIDPFVENQVRKGVISYGLSSYGYDIRVANEFKIFTNVFSVTVDPKQFDPKSMIDSMGRVHHSSQFLCACPYRGVFPHPARHTHHLRRKSTYARCGIIVNVTPFEPEWEGYVTLEISNTHTTTRQDLRQRRHRPGTLL